MKMLSPFRLEYEQRRNTEDPVKHTKEQISDAKKERAELKQREADVKAEVDAITAELEAIVAESQGRATAGCESVAKAVNPASLDGISTTRQVLAKIQHLKSSLSDSFGRAIGHNVEKVFPMRIRYCKEGRTRRFLDPVDCFYNEQARIVVNAFSMK
jgi:chromosome segregation ATPase